MADMQICVLSDSELNEFDPSQHFDKYLWDSCLPQKPVTEFIRALDEDGEFDIFCAARIRNQATLETANTKPR